MYINHAFSKLKSLLVDEKHYVQWKNIATYNSIMQTAPLLKFVAYPPHFFLAIYA